ncbi:MAG: lytic murein transglycosylase [Desulfuromonas sp.]|nr:MAG: lytic murein transglycosylase [Desulfuromonas sp.]
MRTLGMIMTLLITSFWWFTPPGWCAEPTKDFSAWLENLRQEALSSGISLQTVDAALSHIRKPQPKVISRDRKQPEFTQTTARYVKSRVGRERIANGRKMLDRYPTWLGRVEKKYGVQRRFIVALWGIESSYGKHTGNHPVIQSLATLAYDNRRGDYFRKELIEALHIVDEGLVPLRRLKGSWSGALGQCQFMPTSFRHYAVNADGGRLDIWSSVPDVLASTANFLAHAGWRDDQTWGRPVQLPKEFDLSLAGLETRLPLSRWQELGVRRINGTNLPRQDMSASLIVPDGPGGQAYLVYKNFRALLRWNRSTAFAISVGTLADRIAHQ